MTHHDRILVTGATGYVGGRLIPLLANRGEKLRLLARRPDYLSSRVSSRVSSDHEIFPGASPIASPSTVHCREFIRPIP